VRLRRRWVLAGLVGLLLALPWLLWGTYALLALFRHEHFYHGLPSSYWERAVRAWPAAEPPWLDGAPPLLIALTDYLGLLGKEPAVFRGGQAAVPVLGDLLRSRDPRVRRETARAVGNLGPEGSAAARALLEAGALESGEDGDTRETPTGLIIRDALNAMGDAAIPALVEALASGPDPRLRRQAARALAAQLPQAVFPALAAALHDDDARVRELATDALLRLDGWEAAVGTDVLALAMTDEDPHVRAVAWHAVSHRSLPPEPGILAGLTEALRAGDPSARCGAARALARMGRAAGGSEGAKTIAALVAALKDPDEPVREAAAEALRRIAPEAIREVGAE
jgi:HEAT repeat protein